MNNSFLAKFLVVSLAVVSLLFPVVAFCADREAETAEHPVRVAVIPFQIVLPQAEAGNTAICPLCGAVYFSGKIAEGADKVVENLFIEKLQGIKGIEIISRERVEGIYRRIRTEALKTPLVDILKKVRAESGADLIAVGFIFRYTERIGYNYSAEKPASVAFEINLFNHKDSSAFWRGVFDKTQKSLMENLLEIASFYKGGGKWLTARELAKQGMDQVFSTLPELEHDKY